MSEVNNLILERSDILEDDIRDKFPEVLCYLLFDRTTRQNIFWATDNYEHFGDGFEYSSPILPNLITGKYGYVITPRVDKEKELQKSRIRDMAEVFTPSWLCNAQNNLIDNAWFGRQGVFNSEILKSDGTNSWQTNEEKVEFPDGKTWLDYVNDIRLEITCGEAPYITSRYDTTTGEFIPIRERIGLLDRKLRVINENVATSGEWLKAVQNAYKSIYAYEWQGDNLLIARESMLYTFIENYKMMFKKMPQAKSIRFIAYIISWNVWQMDGLKGVVPNSCSDISIESNDLFGAKQMKFTPCNGCTYDDMKRHNGKFCLIKDWTQIDKKTNRKGRKLRFIDLIS